MFPKMSMLGAAFILTALAFGSPQADIQQGLRDGRDLYDLGQYSDAARLLTGVNGRLNATTPTDLARGVKLYLGVSLFLDNKQVESQTVFQQLCRTDPSYEMNRNGREFNQRIVDAFQKAKQTCDEEVKTLCSMKCLSVAQVISGRDPKKILEAVETLGSQCNCGDVRLRAAQTIFDIAFEHFNQQDPIAQSEFQDAVRLNSALTIPKFGIVRLTAFVPGGQLFINDKAVKEFGVLRQSEKQDFLLPPDTYRLSLKPADQGYDPATNEVALLADMIALVELAPKARIVTPLQPAPAAPNVTLQWTTTTLAKDDGFDFDSGRKLEAGMDLNWYERNGTQKIIPVGGDIAILKNPPEQVNLSQLRGLNYSHEPIELTVGISIAVRTSEGKYVVVEKLSKSGAALMFQWKSYQ